MAERSGRRTWSARLEKNLCKVVDIKLSRARSLAVSSLGRLDSSSSSLAGSILPFLTSSLFTSTTDFPKREIGESFRVQSSRNIRDLIFRQTLRLWASLHEPNVWLDFKESGTMWFWRTESPDTALAQEPPKTSAAEEARRSHCMIARPLSHWLRRRRRSTL